MMLMLTVKCDGETKLAQPCDATIEQVRGALDRFLSIPGSTESLYESLSQCRYYTPSEEDGLYWLSDLARKAPVKYDAQTALLDMIGTSMHSLHAWPDLLMRLAYGDPPGHPDGSRYRLLDRADMQTDGGIELDLSEKGRVWRIWENIDGNILYHPTNTLPNDFKESE